MLGVAGSIDRGPQRKSHTQTDLEEPPHGRPMVSVKQRIGNRTKLAPAGQFLLTKHTKPATAAYSPRLQRWNRATNRCQLVTLFFLTLYKFSEVAMEKLTAGLTGQVARTVTCDDTAERWGSGLVPVLGTPSLVALMENAAVRALEGHLPPGRTSVGGRMDVHHLSPTPVGMGVRACAELSQVDGRRLVFEVQAWDEVEQIGRATHERFVVDQAAFGAKARAKAR